MTVPAPAGLETASRAGARSGTFQIASSTIALLIFEPPDFAVGERDRHLDDAKPARSAR